MMLKNKCTNPSPHHYQTYYYVCNNNKTSVFDQLAISDENKDEENSATLMIMILENIDFG